MSAASQFETLASIPFAIPNGCIVAVRRYSWETTYKDAILEIDKSLLHHKIEKAQDAMISRRVTLRRDRHDDLEELNALEDGLRNLRVLKKSEYAPD